MRDLINNLVSFPTKPLSLLSLQIIEIQSCLLDYLNSIDSIANNLLIIFVVVYFITHHIILQANYQHIIDQLDQFSDNLKDSNLRDLPLIKCLVVRTAIRLQPFPSRIGIITKRASTTP